MKPHTRVYMQAFGYGIDDFIPCEVCGKRAVDVHHIRNRKSGGDPKGDKDNITNLMGCCRDCHNEYGDVPELVEMLEAVHLKFLEINGVSRRNMI